MNVFLEFTTAIFEHHVSIPMGRFTAFVTTVFLGMEYHVQVHLIYPQKKRKR